MAVDFRKTAEAELLEILLKVVERVKLGINIDSNSHTTGR